MSRKSLFKLATVISTNDGVSVQFDGETAPSTKKYKRLSSYSSPAVGDRVMLAEIAGTYVIIGKVV